MFYQGKNFTVEVDDLGDTFQLEGIVIGNGHDSLTMLLPDAPPYYTRPDKGMHYQEFWYPTVPQLEAWLKQSDDPVAKLYHDQDSMVVKAVVRKASRQLDQAVAWAVYHRDNYTCVYCGKTGVPLTYDHYLAQAFGGQTTMENGRTSCRPCNKAKGHMTIEQWTEYAAKKGLNDGSTIPA